MNTKKHGLFRRAALLLVLAMLLSTAYGCASAPSDAQPAPAEKTETEAPAEAAALCRITIENGAASANTDAAVNAVHVYDPESADMDDYVSGAEVEAGKAVKIFVYPLASDVHMTVVHNGETIVDKDYAVIQTTEDESSVEILDVTLAGDLTVTTTAIAGTAAPEDDNGAESGETYTVTIDNRVESDDVMLNVMYLDADNAPVMIGSGDALSAGTAVFAQVSNGADAAVRITAAVDGQPVDSMDVGAQEGDTPGAGGLFGVELTGDMVITLEYAG